MVRNVKQQLSKEEALTQIAEKRGALREFRFQINGGKVKNIKTGRELRKDIARLLTTLNVQTV